METFQLTVSSIQDIQIVFMVGGKKHERRFKNLLHLDTS